MFRKIVVGLAFALGLAFAAPAFAQAPAKKEAPAPAAPAAAPAKAAKPKLMNEAVFTKHVKEDIKKWPATKAEIMAACQGCSECDKADKEWFGKALQEGTYKDANELLAKLGMM